MCADNFGVRETEQRPRPAPEKRVILRGTPSRAVGTMQPVDEEDVEARRALATQRNRAVWKEIEPEHDHFPTMSYSQHKLAYIPPAPGTTPTKHRKKSGDFGQFVDKAIRLKVNLSATAHE